MGYEDVDWAGSGSRSVVVLCDDSANIQFSKHKEISEH
jgi:hypothetical protein